MLGSGWSRVQTHELVTPLPEEFGTLDKILTPEVVLSELLRTFQDVEKERILFRSFYETQFRYVFCLLLL